MTFAGTGLSEDEFNNVTFTSSAGTAQTFTMATRGLRLGGLLTINDTSGNTILDTSGSNLAITTGTLTVGSSNGQLTANGSTITVSGSAVFVGGTFVEGTSTLVLAASGNLSMDVTGTRTVNNVYNLTINVGVTTTIISNLGIGQVLTLNGTITGDVADTRAIIFSSTSAAPLVLGGSHSFGNLATVLLASTVDYSVPISTDYPTLDIESDGAATATLAGDITALTIEVASVPSAITLAANSRTITLTQGIILTTTGSGLTFTSGVLVTGSTGNNIISNGTFVQWGSGSHTIANRWVNNNTATNASWDAGTGTVTFTSATASSDSASVFADTNLGEAEFFNITFTSSAGTAQTFTMGTRGLQWSGTLTITDGTGGTTLAKATFGLTGGALTISGAAASGLTSTSGAVSVSTVSISTATAFIDLGSEAWTVSGTWTNSTTSASWDAGTGTVTFTSATGGTMTFAGANLSEAEFSSVTFNSSAAGSQTFTMATRGLSWSGTLTITGDTILAKATFTLGAEASGALTVGGAGANALTSTSGAVTVTTVSIADTGDYIDFGSEAWTVSGAWTNATTSASWDAGTGTMTFTSTVARTTTFAGANLSEDEFLDVSFTGATTFTMATRALRAATITVDGSATLAAGTLDLQFDHLDVDGTMTMDGQTIDNIDINGSVGTITLTEWVLYSISGGLPDIQWTMDPSDATNNIVIIVEGLTPTTTFAVYRDNVEIQQAGSDGSGTLTFSGGSLNSGWSPHGMIINLPGLSFGGGGGGGGGGVAVPIITWTWRHLNDDLTVQFVVASPLSGWTYAWYIGDKKIGEGPVLEYTFERSGTYVVILKATHPAGKIFETINDVLAKSISFVGRYMPVLLLLALAVWTFMLVAMSDSKRGPFVSDGSRLLAMFAGIGLLAVGFWLLSTNYFTISLGSIGAIQMYAGAALIGAVGPVRSRFVKLVFIIVGVVLLVLSYLALVPHL